MTNIVAKWIATAPYLKSILRIVSAFLFIQVGTMKLFSFPAGLPPGVGPIEIFSLVGVAGVLEVFGGGLMLLGLFTRPVAFILSGEMAVAYFMGHFPQGFWPVLNQGTDAVLYCFTWLYFSAAGAGPWSLDSWREKSRVIN